MTNRRSIIWFCVLVLASILAAIFFAWMFKHHPLIAWIMIASALICVLQWHNAMLLYERDERIAELESEIQLFNDLGLCVDHMEAHHGR